MVLVKTEKPNIRNIDLLKTYYSGDKTPVSNKKVASSLKKSHTNILWIGLGSSLLLILITAGIIMGYSSLKKGRVETGTIGTGNGLVSKKLKDTGGGARYTYAQLKASAKPIVLSEENTFAVINLDSVMDLSNTVISFGARGETGTEKVGLILKDIKNMSNANPDDIILTTPLTDNKWHLFKVSLKELDIPIDKNRITQIRFDSSRRLTKNLPSAKTYIKDISIE